MEERNEHEVSKEERHAEELKRRNRRTMLSLFAAASILLGGIGGYAVKDYLDDEPKAAMTAPAEVTNLQQPDTAKEEALSGARETATVRAVKRVGPAVVGITTKVYARDFFDRNVQVGEGVGSGVIFDASGYIVTNNHVVEGAGNGKVTVSMSDGTTTEGVIVGTDPSTDLAVVKISSDKELPVASFGNSDALLVGEPAIAIGNPLGLEFQGSVTTGVISALQRTVNTEEQRFPLIQTDAAINPGNSGGALVNADGLVVGINSSKIAQTGVEGMGFAIPINEARSVLEQLITKGKVERAYLGVWALDGNAAARYGYELKEKGLLVAKLAPGGPADAAGIRRGDIITAIGGTRVVTLVDLKRVIDTLAVGDKVDVTYTSDGRERTVTVVSGRSE